MHFQKISFITEIKKLSYFNQKDWKRLIKKRAFPVEKSIFWKNKNERIRNYATNLPVASKVTLGCYLKNKEFSVIK